MTTITVQQVETAVRRYFEMMANKIPGELSKMYSYDAVVFGPYGPRADLGRVWATIRDREYCHPESNYHFEFTSPIEVQILANNVAVATHTFRSYATNVKEPILGKALNRKLTDGRGESAHPAAHWRPQTRARRSGDGNRLSDSMDSAGNRLGSKGAISSGCFAPCSRCSAWLGPPLRRPSPTA